MNNNANSHAFLRVKVAEARQTGYPLLHECKFENRSENNFDISTTAAISRSTIIMVTIRFIIKG